MIIRSTNHWNGVTIFVKWSSGRTLSLSYLIPLRPPWVHGKRVKAKNKASKQVAYLEFQWVPNQLHIERHRDRWTRVDSSAHKCRPCCFSVFFCAYVDLTILNLSKWNARCLISHTVGLASVKQYKQASTAVPEVFGTESEHFLRVDALCHCPRRHNVVHYALAQTMRDLIESHELANRREHIVVAISV